MGSNLEQVGRMKGNTPIEDLSYYKWDTLLFKGSGVGSTAILKKQQLFTSPLKNSKLLQNEAVPLPKGKAYSIKYMRATTNIVLLDPQQHWAFEQFSRITFNIGDVNYSDIPLSHILTFNRVAWGGIQEIGGLAPTINPVYNMATPKDGSFVKLPSPIVFPEQERMEIFFEPGGADIETASSAVYGTKFGTGIVEPNADDAYFFIKFDFLGTELRERSR